MPKPPAQTGSLNTSREQLPAGGTQGMRPARGLPRQSTGHAAPSQPPYKTHTHSAALHAVTLPGATTTTPCTERRRNWSAQPCRSDLTAARMLITTQHSHILHHPTTTTTTSSLHDNDPPTATQARAMQRCVVHRNTQPPARACSRCSVLWLWHYAGLHIPDVLGVLCDGAVCAELAGTCGHHDAHARPLGLVLVRLVHLVLCV